MTISPGTNITNAPEARVATFPDDIGVRASPSRQRIPSGWAASTAWPRTRSAAKSCPASASFRSASSVAAGLAKA